MRQLLLSFVLIFACANPLLAQQVIDPQEESFQRSVTSLNQHIFVLDKQVYFVAELERGAYAILKLDPTTTQISKAADLPQRLLLAGRFPLEVEKIGQRLLINKREWFEPATGTISNAFATQTSPNNCQFEWQEGLVLNSCSK